MGMSADGDGWGWGQTPVPLQLSSRWYRYSTSLYIQADIHVACFILKKFVEELVLDAVT